MVMSAVIVIPGRTTQRRVGVSISFFDFAPAVRVLDLLGGESRIGELAGDLAISSEFLLIPLLISALKRVGRSPSSMLMSMNGAVLLGGMGIRARLPVRAST